ncbi:MAG: LysR family transcriptional regulator [Actinomycetales bacterium]|nr:LysR family transcriptional regulator [Actinomycetales bacterium]
MFPDRVPDLAALGLLLDVAATGSLTRAAAEHGVSQPAASARIAGMERLLGFPVLVRSSTGSRLTPQGALVADWARDLLASAAALDAGAASLRADRDVRLPVAASLTVAEHLLPRWLVTLAVEHPDTVVSLDAMNSAAVARAVLDRGADLGFVEGPSVPAGMHSRTVARDRLLVVVPAGHPWTRRRGPVPAAELAATRLVHREPASGTRVSWETALAAHAPFAPPLLELSSAGAVRSAIAAGAGPGVISSLAAEPDLAGGRLAVVAVEGMDLERRLRAVWPRGARLTGAAQDLLEIALRAPRR